MQGRRMPDDCSIEDYEPGSFGKRMTQIHIDDEPFMCWWFCDPNGNFGRLCHPRDRHATGSHHVEEHEDGMVTVVPQPGNSNSIKNTGFDENHNLQEWHGFIRHGVWESC